MIISQRVRERDASISPERFTAPGSTADVTQRILDALPDDAVVGIGTGTLCRRLLEQISDALPADISVVAASDETAQAVRRLGLSVLPNGMPGVPDWAIVEADEIDIHGRFTLSGSDGLLRDKVLCELAVRRCVVHTLENPVPVLGQRRPVSLEVLPLARSAVGRAIAAMRSTPKFQLGLETLDGLDLMLVYGLDLTDPVQRQAQLRSVPGVIETGLVTRQSPSISVRVRDDE